MARNNNKMTRTTGKIEPAVQTMNFSTLAIPAGITQTFFVDLSQCASLLCRRFYRQGLQWAVAGIKITSGTTPAAGGSILGSITLSKLPQTWVMGNSWEKSFAMWSQMNNEALAENESVRPRFLDFKIFADSAHHTAGIAANMLPFNLGGIANPGEWESSKLRIPVGPANPGDTTDREIIAVGANYPGVGASGLNAVSAIEGYAASRGLPNIVDPNVPDDASDSVGVLPENWMAAIFNEGTEQHSAVIDDLISENNVAPYPFENDGVNIDTMYPGGANQLPGLELHDQAPISGTTVGGTTRLKGGLFPCGLLKFIITNDSDQAVLHNIQLNMVPGPHRGYLAAPMQEM